MTPHRNESRETRASHIRVFGAFTILRQRGYEFVRADAIAYRFNRRFSAASHATTTPAERAEIKARADKGRKELGWGQ